MAKKQAKEPCRECAGTGLVPWGTEMLKCAACDGKGTARVQKPSSKGRGGTSAKG